MKKLIILALIIVISCKNSTESGNSDSQSDGDEAVEKEWVSLFNGKNLDGWTPKFAKSEYGVIYRNTFRVEDGVIKVRYNEYEEFNGEFGHLFYKDSLTNYHLKLEYRFLGEQCPGGPGWAFKNSGVMYHCVNPEKMNVDQSFPDCLEGQFLGGNGKEDRPTGNLCTPGTHAVINGELVTDHCINSNSKTIHDSTWVLAEFIVHGSDDIYHLIDGDTVFHLTDPVYGGGNLEYKQVEGQPVNGGWISLQAESHPLEFRNIMLKELD